MEITCRVYRPSRARDTPLFRLVEQHLEFLRVYEERFARVHGPLRGVVERVVPGVARGEPRHLEVVVEHVGGRKPHDLRLKILTCALPAL